MKYCEGCFNLSLDFNVAGLRDEDPGSPHMKSSWRRESPCRSNTGTECSIFNIRYLIDMESVCVFRKNSWEWLHLFYIWKVSHRHGMRILIYGLISMLQDWEKMKIRAVHAWRAAEEEKVHARAIQVQNVQCSILGHKLQWLSFMGWRIIYKEMCK